MFENLKISFFITSFALLGSLMAISSVAKAASPLKKPIEIVVENKGKKTIWVTIRSQETNLVEIQQANKNEQSQSTSVGLKKRDELNVEGLGGVANERELNVSHSNSSRKEQSSAKKYDWSPFIKAGEAEIAPGSKEKFAATHDIYYLTVRRSLDSFWRVNVPKVTNKAKVLRIDGNKYWDPISESIPNGSMIRLSHKMGKLARPIDSHSFYNLATAGKSGAIFYIQRVRGGSGMIAHENVVRLRVKQPKRKNKDYLYHGAYDNNYYENKYKDEATQWIVKVPRGGVLRSGMKVQLQNKRWDKFLTIERGSGLNWVKSLPEYGHNTDWTIELYVQP